MAVIVSGFIIFKSCMDKCTYICICMKYILIFIIRNLIIRRKIITLLLNIIVINYFLIILLRYVLFCIIKISIFHQLLKYFWKYNKFLYSILYLLNPIFIAKNFLLDNLFFATRIFLIKIKFCV